MVDFALSNIQERGYVFWIAGMATGKSATSLKVAESIDAKRVLILSTKASVESTWPKQVAVHTEGLELLALTEYQQVNGKRKKYTVPEKGKLMLAKVKSTVEYLAVAINYESARELGKEIKACNFDLVIVDECHKLKSHGSKVLKALAKACQYIPAKVAMTGTAFNDTPLDLFGQIAFLDPYFYQGYVGSNLFGKYTDFFDAYVNYYVSNNLKIPNKSNPYKNLDKLQEAINPFTFTIKTENAVDLPPTQYIRRTVKPSPTLRKAYDEMAKDMVTHLDDKLAVADNVLTQALRLAQMTGGYATPYHIDSEGNYIGKGEPIEIKDGDCKLQELLSILDEIGKEPVVVFTRFTPDLVRIKTKLTELGYEVLELSGRMHENNEWQAGKGQVLVTNISAGSTSVTLTRATFVIDFSVGLSRTDYDQSRYRCRRPESKLDVPIIYYQIAVENTVDETILNALQAKGDMAELLRQGLINKIAS